MSPVLLWIVFFLFFLPSMLLLVRQMPARAFIVSVGFATFQDYTYYVDMPVPVFWILLVLLLPTLLIPMSGGSVLFYTLVIAHVHITAPDLPTTWLLAGLFWIVFVLMWPVSMFIHDRVSISCFVCWMTIAILLRDKIHLLMSIGYWVAWPALFGFLKDSLPPEMPVSWHILCLSLILISGLVIHPGISLVRFISFTTSVLFLVVPRHLYIFPFFYPETYLFPYNLISGYWKVGSPQWYSISERPDSTGHLCEQCRRFTTESKLIMGTKFPLVRLVEWHKFWDSFEDLCYSALDINPPCQLCNLLWHSITWKGRRQPSQVKPFPLSIKIWEERPLSRYTCAQLYREDNAIGTRLLIHRGELFGDPSLASYDSWTGSDHHTAQAKSWMTDCRAHHKLCNGVGIAPMDPPTRLIYVAPTDPSEPRDSPPAIKIKPTNPADGHLEYLAFSHCWGGSNPFKLLNSNIEDCLRNIELTELPKNMKDAVQITRNLGYSYLWIDSLCIIQDSKIDWETEAAKMGDVYAGAVCTIASTGSSTSDGGCFHERNSTLSMRPCKIGVSSLGTSSSDPLHPDWIYVRRDDLSDFSRGVDGAPLNQRGWVLQERLLSRRILHFGSEMIYWECCQRAASELNKYGYVYKRYPEEFYGNFIPTQSDVDPTEREKVLSLEQRWDRTELVRRRIPPPSFDPHDLRVNRAVWKDGRGFWKEIRRPSTASWLFDSDNDSRFRSALDKLQSSEFGKAQFGTYSFSHCWYEIVELYSRRQLTFSKDKLVAIQGIVQHVQRANRFEYVAGLWKEHLETDILWFTAEGPGRRLLESAPPQKAKISVSKPAQISTGKSTGEREEQSVPQQAKDSISEPAVASVDKSIHEQVDEHILEQAKDSTSKPAEASADKTIEEQKEGPVLKPTEETSPRSAKPAPLMAPTWSWASIEGIVTLDLLPVNAGRKVRGKSLVSELNATASRVKSEETGELGFAQVGVLEIKGPLSKISKVTCDEKAWYIGIGMWGRPSARLFPDVVVSEYDIASDPDLFCLSCLVLKREAEETVRRRSIEEIQGLVLRRRLERVGEPDVFERVGFFTTSRMDRRSSYRGRLKRAPAKFIHIV